MSSPDRPRTALLVGAGLAALAVALLASLAVLRLDCACEPSGLPAVAAPTDLSAIGRTVEAPADGMMHVPVGVKAAAPRLAN